MMKRVTVGVLVVVLGVVAAAEDKKNEVRTANLALIQKAETVAVIVFPNASAPIDDPHANGNAQDSVEQALTKWGRFRMTMDTHDADIVIAIRKGNDKPMTPTISGGGVNDRPVILQQPTDQDMRIGVQHGTPPPVTEEQRMPRPSGPHMGAASGGSDDVFEVYRGKQEYPLDSAPLWRYSGKDILNAPKVKAVEAFRKALEKK